MIQIPPQLQKEQFGFCLVNYKKPFEKEWSKPENTYKYNDPKLLKQIAQKKNYGVVGGIGDIMIVDADNPKVTEAFAPYGDTFTIQTGHGHHLYYIVYGLDKSYSLQEETEDSTLEDLQLRNIGHITSKGRMVVGPTCPHYNELNENAFAPSGKHYDIIKDVPIRTIHANDVRAAIKPFLPETIKQSKEIQNEAKKDIGNRLELSIQQVMDILIKEHPDWYKESTSPPGYRGHNPDHPKSKSRMDLSIDTKKNWFICSPCCQSGYGFGNTLYFIALIEGILHCNECKALGLRGEKFSKAVDLAINKYGFPEEAFRTPLYTGNDDTDTKINPVIVDQDLEELENHNNDIEEENTELKNDSVNDNSFLATVDKYYESRTNAPKHFGEHLTLHIIGHAVGVHTRHYIQPRPIGFNTDIVILAPSTVSHKTTIQELAINLCSGQRLPSSFSPEGLLKSMENNPQGILPMGEFSTVLRHIKGQGYMSGFKEIANELHGCPAIYEKRLSKMKDSVIIIDPYLCISTTCTPEEFYSNLNDELVYGGFLARFILVDGKVTYKERQELPPDVLKEEARLRKVIWKINELFNKENEKVAFKFTPDGLIEFNRIDRMLMFDPQYNTVKPFVGRYLDYIIVYADLLFLSDLIGEIGIDNFNNFNNLNNLNNLNNFTKNDTIYKEKDNLVKQVKLLKLLKLYVFDPPQQEKKQFHHLFCVPAEYVTRAFHMLKPCLRFASDVVRYVNEDMVVAKLSSVLEKHAPLVRATAMRYSKLQKKDFKEALETLQEREEIFELSIEHASKQFRPLRVYCIRENIDSKKCLKCPYKCSLDQRFPRLKGYRKEGK